MTLLREGDLFLIPIGDGRAAVGQVVATYLKRSYYFAIFERLCRVDSDVSTAAESIAGPVRFLVLSFDALVHAGEWPVVGRAPVSDTIDMPAYKLATAGGWQIQDFTGARLRPAAASEIGTLPYRIFVAPVRLENALRADLGLEDWHPRYDELRPPHSSMTTRALFG